MADQDFDALFVESLGQALGTWLIEQNEFHMVVGRDCRVTSEKYAQAFIRGLTRTGIHTIVLGICPTPLVYFAIHDQGFNNGVSITGSHNPAEYNGFKISIKRSSLYGPQIQELKIRIADQKYHVSPSAGNISYFNIQKAYQDFMLRHFSKFSPLKVVIDAGNGVAGPVAPSLLRKLGCQVTELFCDLDGLFPNHFPDPTVLENLDPLRKKVLEERADLGIAFDGDADRIGVIGPDGTPIWGDTLMIIYAREIAKKNPNAPIIGEVKCSSLLFSEIKKAGGRPIIWKTGHSLIKSKIKEENALFAGEMSGHMFFADRYYGFDDAIYAALRLVEILSKSKKTLSQLLSDVPSTFSTPEIRIDCPDEKKFDVVKSVSSYFKSRYSTLDIDGIRIEFSEGWGLVRASNTQPALVLRFEANTLENLQKIRSQIEGKLKEFL